MSLKHFQQAWMALVFNPSARSAWLAGDNLFHGLEPEEQASLRGLTSAYLEQVAALEQTQHLAVLEQMLPVRVRHLLGEEQTAAFLAHFLEQKMMPPLYPTHPLLSVLLNHLLLYLSEHNLIIPHLRDLISYELTAAHLDFFKLPQVSPEQRGPVLATWARVVRLGKHFPLVISQNRRDLATLSETPKQDFLMLRDFKGLKLEKLAPISARCLLQCQGDKSWAEILTALGPNLQVQAMQSLYEQYLQRGILSDREPVL